MIIKPFSEFISHNTHTFRELLANRSKHIFRVHIKHYWHFQGITLKQYYTLFQTSNSTDISRELLANNIIHFSRASIKQYWHFQRVTDKYYYTVFQGSHQTTLIFSKSYWKQYRTHFKNFHQAILTWKLLANNTTNVSRLSYHHQTILRFSRVTTKQYWLIHQSSCQTVFTFSQSYYQTIVSACFNGHLNRQKILKQKNPK